MKYKKINKIFIGFRKTGPKTEKDIFILSKWLIIVSLVFIRPPVIKKNLIRMSVKKWSDVLSYISNAVVQALQTNLCSACCLQMCFLHFEHLIGVFLSLDRGHRKHLILLGWGGCKSVASGWPCSAIPRTFLIMLFISLDIFNESRSCRCSCIRAFPSNMLNFFRDILCSKFAAIYSIREFTVEIFIMAKKIVRGHLRLLLLQEYLAHFWSKLSTPDFVEL